MQGREGTWVQSRHGPPSISRDFHFFLMFLMKFIKSISLEVMVVYLVQIQSTNPLFVEWVSQWKIFSLLCANLAVLQASTIFQCSFNINSAVWKETSVTKASFTWIQTYFMSTITIPLAQWPKDTWSNESENKWNARSNYSPLIDIDRYPTLGKYSIFSQIICQNSTRGRPIKVITRRSCI